MEQKTFRTLIICTVAVLLIWAVAGTYRCCKTSDLVEQYESEIKVLRASAELAGAEYKKALDNATKEIGHLNGIISQAEVVVTDLEGDIADRDNLLSDLREQLDALPDEETVVILRKRVDILTETVEQWREKFVLAEAIIAEKDTMIFALSEKYELEHTAHLKLEMAYNSLGEYNQRLVEFNKELSRAYGTSRAIGKLKTAGLITAGAVIIYTILKGNG